MLETRWRKVLIWKSSDLALLFHGRGLQLGDGEGMQVNGLGEMGQRAAGVSARLVVDKGEWRLVQV